MTQGALPFKYEEEKREGGMTALGGIVGLFGSCPFSGVERFDPSSRKGSAGGAGTGGCSDGFIVGVIEYSRWGLCG
jgi:hypothetical protein